MVLFVLFKVIKWVMLFKINMKVDAGMAPILRAMHIPSTPIAGLVRIAVAPSLRALCIHLAREDGHTLAPNAVQGVIVGPVAIRAASAVARGQPLGQHDGHGRHGQCNKRRDGTHRVFCFYAISIRASCRGQTPCKVGGVAHSAGDGYVSLGLLC